MDTLGIESRTDDAVIYLPGLMGSELRDSEGCLVWGFAPRLLVAALRSDAPLQRLHLDPECPDDGITATGLAGWAMLPRLWGTEPPADLVQALRTNIAVHPAAVKVVPYDWRQSIRDLAPELATAARAHLESWRRHPQGNPDAKLSLVCHSMGGLVARYYVDVLGGGADVRRVVTLGTPFFGSVKAILALDRGHVLPFGFRARAVCALVCTFPSIYELTPRYRCVETNDGSLCRLAPDDLAAIGADPSLAEAADRTHREIDAGKTRGYAVYRAAIGLRQPTLQSAIFDGSRRGYLMRLGEENRDGDGTVYREAACLPHNDPKELAQQHKQLANSKEAIEFVRAKLTDHPQGPPLGPDDGIGLQVPDVVPVGQPFAIVVHDALEPTRCTAIDVETGALADSGVAYPGAEHATTDLTLSAPGLYDIRADSPAGSPVSALVLAV